MSWWRLSRREQVTDRHRTLTTRHVGALSRRSLYALPLLVVNSLFTDGAAISLSVAVGPPWASTLHWLLLAPWACLMLWVLHHRVLPDAVAEWVERREQVLGAKT